MLERLVRRIVHTGRLRVQIGAKRVFEAGVVSADAPHLDVSIRVRTPLIAAGIALDPELRLGEAYVSGDLVIERGTLRTLFELLGRNAEHWSSASLGAGALLRRALSLSRGVSLGAAARNAQFHYDLDGRLYRLFLDSQMQYSCAYFARPSMTLEDAQQAKQKHIIAKLALEPGQRVLDIGSGWGGLSVAIAKACPGVSVLGVTLSHEQLYASQRLAEREKLSDRVCFQLADYRKVEGFFDRIVSVGMFEHVGKGDHRTYFNAVANLLADEGVALIHSIGCKTLGGGRNPWIDKYIFPGGYIPSVSELAAAVEASGLWICDMEILRRHYAETLRLWRERFLEGRGSVLELYDDRFYRLWDFYLCSCEMAFRYGDLMVMQAQLAKQAATLPITRDYMLERERAFASQPVS